MGFTVSQRSIPISNPAGIAVRTLPIDAVAEVTVFARRTLIFTVLSEVSLHTHLITFCPVPAALTRYTSTVRHLTGLLAFTVATSESTAKRKDQDHPGYGQSKKEESKLWH